VATAASLLPASDTCPCEFGLSLKVIRILTACARFFSGQMHVFRPRTDLFRCLLVLIPIICALMVATSRLADYRHDVYDVTSGTILGSVVSHFCYRRYFPPLRSLGCDTPYSKDDFGPEGFSRVPDDEEQLLSGRRGQTWSGDSYQLEEMAAVQNR
jgi:diacylglycerol diphosphate phosphatase/phosphatidate phosphatase